MNIEHLYIYTLLFKVGFAVQHPTIHIQYVQFCLSVCLKNTIFLAQFTHLFTTMICKKSIRVTLDTKNLNEFGHKLIYSFYRVSYLINVFYVNIYKREIPSQKDKSTLSIKNDKKKSPSILFYSYRKQFSKVTFAQKMSINVNLSSICHAFHTFHFNAIS